MDASGVQNVVDDFLNAVHVFVRWVDHFNSIHKPGIVPVLTCKLIVDVDRNVFFFAQERARYSGRRRRSITGIED
jgi:hypothetical protein